MKAIKRISPISYENGYEDGSAKADALEMEVAGLKQLLEEIGNELLMAGDDGAWYAEQGDSPFMHKLADKLNKTLL